MRSKWHRVSSYDVFSTFLFSLCLLLKSSFLLLLVSLLSTSFLSCFPFFTQFSFVSLTYVVEAHFVLVVLVVVLL